MGALMQQLNQPVWTALVTPFHVNGAIDFKGFEALIVKQEKAGNALLILGSTGEALALSMEDKKAIIKWMATLSLKVPVMVGVGGFQLEEQIEWIKFCQETAKIDAFLLVTPMYAKPGLMGQVKWFEALLDASCLPCMLYNVPGRTAVKLIPEVLAHLKDHSKLWSLKEASGNLEEFKAFQKVHPTLVMYSGDDALVKEHVACGAKGVVSVASNVWPEAVHHYVSLCVRGASPECANWVDACNALFLSSNPIPVKVLMHQKGLIATAMLRLPLTMDDLSQDKLGILLQQDQWMNQWVNKAA